MADAYDIMAMAKRSGAAVQLKEDWENYQDELAAYQKKQGKAGFWGGLGSIALGLLMPAAIPALAGGGLGALLGTGAARGLTQFAGGEALRSLFGGKGGQPKYKGTSTGPYGRAGAKAQQRQADMIRRDIKEQLEGGERGRMFTSALSGFAPEIKSGVYKKEFGDIFSTAYLPEDYGIWDELYEAKDYTQNPISNLITGGGNILGKGLEYGGKGLVFGGNIMSGLGSAGSDIYSLLQLLQQDRDLGR
jgi:hypothetical protein